MDIDSFDNLLQNECRTCMGKETVIRESIRERISNQSLISMCNTVNSNKFGSLTIMELLKQTLPQLTIEANDMLPQNICVNCFDKVIALHAFQQQSLEVEKHLRDLMETSPVVDDTDQTCNELIVHMKIEPLTVDILADSDFIEEISDDGENDREEESGTIEEHLVLEQQNDVISRMFDDNDVAYQSSAKCASDLVNSGNKYEDIEYIIEDNMEHITEDNNIENVIADAGWKADNVCSAAGGVTFPSVSKKGLQNPQFWKSNIRKRLRESGESYVSISQKEVPARRIKAPCTDCFLKCTEVFTNEDRMKIFKSFWNLSDDLKNSFYFKFVSRHHVKRRRKDSVAKQFSFYYHFEKNQTMHRVCRTFFMNTLCIDQKRIYHSFACLSDAETGAPLPRKKGKHVKRVTAPNKIADVREHISSFPTINIRNSRTNSKKKFVDANLSLSTMYKLYIQKYQSPVAIHIYRSVFNKEFNITFHKSKKRN